MAKYDICEALYAKSDGIVVPRRRSMLLPAAIVAVGVVIIVVNAFFVEATVSNSNLKSALVLFGAVFIVLGVVYALMRQAGEPYHLQDDCFLAKKELKFYKERNKEIRDLVMRADFATLQLLPEDGISAVTVVLYTSPRSGFCAAQVFEYEDMEMLPTSDLVVKS